MSVHKFLALFDMFLSYDWPFLHACIVQGNVLFSTLILASVLATMSSFIELNIFFLLAFLLSYLSCATLWPCDCLSVRLSVRLKLVIYQRKQT